MKARGRPHRRHDGRSGAEFRRPIRFTIIDIFANAVPPFNSTLRTHPISFSNSRASSSVLAVVTMVISIPWDFFI
jgi:hypothetical protein